MTTRGTYARRLLLAGTSALAAACACFGTAANAEAAPFVYAVTGNGGSVYAYDAPLGSLTHLGPDPSAPGSRAVEVSPDGRYVYVGGFGVKQFAVGADGRLSLQSAATDPSGSGVTDVAVSADGRFVYASEADGAAAQYRVGDDGALTFGAATADGGMSGDGVAVTPDGRNLYVTHDRDDTLSRYRIGLDGTLTTTPADTIATADEPVGVAVNPDGRSLYVTQLLPQGVVSQFTIGPDGALSPKAPATASADSRPIAIAVTPGGRYAYVANLGSSITRYAVSAGGALTKISPSLPVGGLAESVAVRPDGQSLYVGFSSGSLRQFAIGADGGLTLTDSTFVGSSAVLGVAAGPDAAGAQPTATIAVPTEDAVYAQDSAVASDFSCFEGFGGPGTASCLDQDGDPTGTPIDTSTPGTHALTVTATSLNGRTGTRTVSYTVVHVNGPPLAGDQHVSTDEDTNLPITLTASDPDGGELTFGHGQPAHGSVSCPDPTHCLYDPDSGYHGPDSFDFTVTDDHGATDTGTIDITVVDSIPPETTIATGPAGPTSDNTPTFGFSSEAGATFACRVDTGAFTACSSPFTAAALGDGPHTFQVRATDAAGNTDASPASRAFSVDTAAPDTTISSGPPPASTDGTPSFGFTATEAGSTFACRIDGGAFSPCTSPTSVPLGGGAHTFAVRATDPAGNTDPTPASTSFRICSGPLGGLGVLLNGLLPNSGLLCS